jgi:hypothetical protein
MPGHTLRAECACRFSRELSPGARQNGLYIMAYTEDSKDLGTFHNEEARERGLTTLQDPCLRDEEEEERLLESDDPDKFFEKESALKEQPHGPYRCPKCGNDTLLICFAGFWD